MSSIFAYYRPRGVKGNFIVAIVLDLIETESATISVARKRGTNCGHCGVQTPRIERQEVNPKRKMDEGQESRWELYRIDQIVAPDVITIQVKDKDVVPVQETHFQAFFAPTTATVSTMNSKAKDGFEIREIPFQMNNINFGVITFNSIQVVDWGVNSQMIYDGSVEKKSETTRVKQLLFEEYQHLDVEEHQHSRNGHH